MKTKKELIFQMRDEIAGRRVKYKDLAIYLTLFTIAEVLIDIRDMLSKGDSNEWKTTKD